MKRLWMLSAALSLYIYSFAQQTEGSNNNDYGDIKGGFKQENIFIGGSLNVGLGSGQFSIGGSPEIGYSFAQWLDAGMGFNINYTSLRDNTYSNPTNTKLRQLNYGLGPFVRVYPINFLFVQGQFEENWTRVTLKDASSTASYKQTVHAPSLIAGIGYTQRTVGQGSYYFMVGLDILQKPNSPYVDYNSLGQTVAQPIIRAGFNFYLKPSKQQAREPRPGDNHTL